MRGELLIKARKALNEIWNRVPIHGRTWGVKKNTAIMCGSHITLIDYNQCVTIWELDGELRIKSYGSGGLLESVVDCLEEAELYNRCTTYNYTIC